MRLRFFFAPIFAATLAIPGSSGAATAPDLSARVIVDGISDEYELGEGVFGLTDSGVPEEDVNDSLWGPFNDINQIKITWDAQNLYIACDGFIWGNNMMLFLDPTGAEADDEGLTQMTDVNSWRRNFTFSEDFTPELFLATWDGNSAPQLWSAIADQPNQVVQTTTGQFLGVATFLQGTPGRSMEAAIPWSLVFRGESRVVVDPESGVDTWEIPQDMDHLRIAAVITAGPDGTGGPDSAPDNLTGHQNDSAVLVTIDNYAIVPLDLDGDRLLDFGIEPRDRLSFKLRPPVRSIRFEVASMELTRKIVSPEEGRTLGFRAILTPELGPEDQVRTVTLTAKIYNSLGTLVRTLYTEDRRSARDPFDDSRDQWDGRDERGRMVDGGIYILSVVTGELPGQSRVNTAFGVVR